MSKFTRKFDRQIRKFDEIGDRFDARKRKFRLWLREFRKPMNQLRKLPGLCVRLAERSARWLRRYWWHCAITAATVTVAIVGGRAWWKAVHPRELTVAVFTDYAFRLQHGDWPALVESRFAEVDRLYAQAGTRVRWRVVSRDRVDPTSTMTGLDNRRNNLPFRAQDQADVLVALTGVAEPNRTGSSMPFSHAVFVSDAPNEPESRNALILAHELAHLFGAPNDPAGSGGIMAEPPRNAEFSPRLVALIRQMREYNFSVSGDGLLEGTWSARAVNSLAQADPGTYRSPLAHAHLVVATALVNQLHRDAAIPHLREAVRLDPKDAAMHRNLARAMMLAGSGQEDQAQAELQEAIRLAPDDPDTHQTMGALLIKMRRPEEAVAELQVALRLAPNDAVSQAAMGVALGMQAGRTDDAITAFHEALRLDPSLRLASRDLQLITAARERAQQDLALRRSKVQQAPSDPEAHYRLALALSRLGQIPEAVRELEESRKLRPDYGPLYNQLASLYYIQGDYAAAWREVKKAKELGTEPTQEFRMRLTLRMPPPK